MTFCSAGAVPVYEAVFAFDMIEAAKRLLGPTLILQLTTDDEAHFGPQAARLASLIRNATSDNVAVTLGAAMGLQGVLIAEAALKVFISHEA